MNHAVLPCCLMAAGTWESVVACVSLESAVGKRAPVSDPSNTGKETPTRRPPTAAMRVLCAYWVSVAELPRTAMRSGPRHDHKPVKRPADEPHQPMRPGLMTWWALERSAAFFFRYEMM